MPDPGPRVADMGLQGWAMKLKHAYFTVTAAFWRMS